jgi:glucosamine kinase
MIKELNVSEISLEGNLFVGIDGGGTKCKARLENEKGQLLAEAMTGPANAARDLSGSIKNIIRACEMCLKAAGLAQERLRDLHVGIGLAGINIPSVKAAFEEIELPFASYQVTTDLHIACLGAHKGQSGTVVIVGTGSSGIAVNNEYQVILGGHGFQVGDKGSGAWIGKTALAHCLEALDGIVEPNTLTRAIMSHLDCNKTIDLVAKTVSAPPSFFASLSPLVFDLANNNQKEALSIVEEAAHYISKLSAQLLQHSPSRLSFIGGVSIALSEYFPEALKSQILPAQLPPESGAILFIKSTQIIESFS